MALLVSKETEDDEEEAKNFSWTRFFTDIELLVRCLRTQRSIKAVERVRDS